MARVVLVINRMYLLGGRVYLAKARIYQKVPGFNRGAIIGKVSSWDQVMSGNSPGIA